MDEQPVAFATISRSPNNCDSSFRYGVSPHPAQASENSNSGWRYCVPRTVPKSTRDLSTTGSVSKNATSRLVRSGDDGPRLIAFTAESAGADTGHASTHSPQPGQSSP